MPPRCSSLLVAAAGLTAALAAGCGGDDSPPPPPPPGPNGSVEIGTGALDGAAGFVAFSSGNDITLAPGSQGGFHVFVNLRLDAEAAAAVGEIPLVARVARRVSDGVLVSRTLQRRVRLVEREGVFETEASLPLFLCPTPIGVAVGDRPIELTVEVSDADETNTYEATIRFTPRCPADDTATFCANICFG